MYRRARGEKKIVEVEEEEVRDEVRGRGRRCTKTGSDKGYLLLVSRILEHVIRRVKCVPRSALARR